jgi:aspartate aminotransferase
VCHTFEVWHTYVLKCPAYLFSAFPLIFTPRKTGIMSQLSQLAETLIGSEIVRLGNEINTRISKGEKIYNYTIGDFDPKIFPIPQELEDGIVQAYRDKYTNYPPGDGVLELRLAVAEFIKDQMGISYETNEVLIASGGRPLIYSMFRSIVNKGDKVIYAVPSWNNNHYVHMNEGEHCVVEARLENDFMPTAEDIAPHIAGAALLCLCTPQNPTGTTLQKETLEKICDLVIEENKKRGENEKKLYVMFDQMYFTLTYGDTVHYNPVSIRPEMKQYTIFIDGLSKAFAATGLRVGWSLGPAHVMAKMKALLSHIGAWAPMAEQKAAAVYLLKKDAIATYMAGFKAGLEERLQTIYKGIHDLKAKGYSVDAVAPQAAMYLTIKIDLAGKKDGDFELATQTDVTSYLLTEAKLAIVPFYAFGADKKSPWYRLSVGTAKLDEIPQMFAQLEAALAKLS